MVLVLEKPIAIDVVREFVEDVKLAYGVGDGSKLDLEALDWFDLAITYQKAVRVLEEEDS